MADRYERIYAQVRRIPRGRVATYGQIAALSGSRLSAMSRHRVLDIEMSSRPNGRGAQLVGWALHALPSANDVPWHRVVNREGRLTIQHEHVSAQTQAAILRTEGVRVRKDADGFVVDLERYGWRA
ncbi:MAG: MGMT family protein [Candidatus Kerfeldbacteria bacterium]|nr:MGMT family protein [Candidatus Kerfeldbacteria bacterium]